MTLPQYRTSEVGYEKFAIFTARQRCISYRKTVRPSVRLSHAGTVSKRLQLAYDHAVFTGG